MGTSLTTMMRSILIVLCGILAMTSGQVQASESDRNDGLTQEQGWAMELITQIFSWLFKMAGKAPPTQPAAVGPKSECAEGWVNFQDSCYLFVGELLENGTLVGNVALWQEAGDNCTSMKNTLGLANKPHLTSIQSEEENMFLMSRSKFAWIGLYRAPRYSWEPVNVMNLFHWAWSDGTEVRYTNWGKGEPKDNGNSLGQSYNEATIGRIDFDESSLVLDGTWMNADGTWWTWLPYICEYKL